MKENGNNICAWHMETIGVDLKSELLVGKGTVLCAIAYYGPFVNFGKYKFY